MLRDELQCEEPGMSSVALDCASQHRKYRVREATISPLVATVRVLYVIPPYFLRIQMLKCDRNSRWTVCTRVPIMYLVFVHEIAPDA
jgi:hypothetical protein